MTRIFAAIPALALTVACAESGQYETDTDGVAPEQIDDVEEGSDLEWEVPQKSDLDAGGPDEGFEPEPEPNPEGETDNPSEYPGMDGFEPPEGWQRANIPAGAYWMQFGEVYEQPASDFPVQPGHREVVVAPEIGGYAYLFGTAPILTDLTELSAEGVRLDVSDEGDCTVTHTVAASGWHTSDTSFDMHVTETIETVGADCESMEKGSPGTESWDYLASFAWMPPEGP